MILVELLHFISNSDLDTKDDGGCLDALMEPDPDGHRWMKSFRVSLLLKKSWNTDLESHDSQ